MSWAIANAQDMLKLIGFDPGPIDCILGPRTRAAAKAFQASRGITVDGIPGPVTGRHLLAAVLLPLLPQEPPPLALLAQASLETGQGLRIIRTPDNVCSWNIFNVKGSYKGKSVPTRTWEVVDGKVVPVVARFRLYPSPAEAVQDYLELVQRPHYARAWACRGDSLAYITALHAAGYATDPAYVAKVGREAVAIREALRVPS